MKRSILIAIQAALYSASAYADENLSKVAEAATNYTLQISVTGGYAQGGDDGHGGSGTGFIIDREKGWVLTNAHVARQTQTRLTAAFKDNVYFDAHRIWVDNYLDLAILEIPPEKIPKQTKAAELECDRLPKPGDDVATLGHPAYLNYTLTTGVVSGLRWKWPDELIQADINMKHGNSGGALIDISSGKVIGITSMMESTKDDPLPTALSLPIVHACKIIDLLRNKGDLRFRQLRVAFADSGKSDLPTVAVNYDQSEPFQVGDVVLGIVGQKPIRNLADLSTQLRGMTDAIPLKILRDGKEIEIKADTYPEEDNLKIRSIFVNGLIISNPWKLDRNTQGKSNYFVIDDINDYSEFDFLRTDYGADLIYVDKKQFNNIDDLYEYLKEVPVGKEMHFIIRSQSNFLRYYNRYRDISLIRGELGWFNAEDAQVYNE